MRLVALASLLCLVACDGPTPTTPPDAPSNVTSFHVSIFNACTYDVTVEVAERPGTGGKKVLLMGQARETITGARERLHLLGKNGEVLDSFQPIQGDQKVQVSADCTALEKAG